MTQCLPDAQNVHILKAEEIQHGWKTGNFIEWGEKSWGPVCEASINVWCPSSSAQSS